MKCRVPLKKEILALTLHEAEGDGPDKDEDKDEHEVDHDGHEDEVGGHVPLLADLVDPDAALLAVNVRRQLAVPPAGAAPSEIGGWR